jgi:hypothetical protein
MPSWKRQRQKSFEPIRPQLQSFSWRDNPNRWRAITRPSFGISASGGPRSFLYPSWQGVVGGPGNTQKVRLGRSSLGLHLRFTLMKGPNLKLSKLALAAGLLAVLSAILVFLAVSAPILHHL